MRISEEAAFKASLKAINGESFQATTATENAYLQSKYWHTLGRSAVAGPAALAKLRAARPELAGLTDGEIVAIRQYTTRAYVPLNSALRTAGDPTALAKVNVMLADNFKMPAVTLEDAQPFAETLTLALDKLPTYSGGFFRGEGTERLAVFQAMKPGDVWTEPAFFSGAYSIEGAMDRPVRFILQTRTARKIDEISTLNDEWEILFKPGARFRFESVEYNADLGKWIIGSSGDRR